MRSTGAASTCCFALATDTLLVHFGMTGSLRVFARAAAARRTTTSTSCSTTASRCATTTRAASARCCGSPAPAEAHPLLARARSRAVRRGVRRRLPLARDAAAARAAIKLALMDNHLVVGVGNIYANEALFRAGIRPTHAGGSRVAPRLGAARRRSSARRSPRRSPRAAARCATTSTAAASPATSSSTTSSTDARAARAGAAGPPIREIRQGGRATYYCPRCQR